MYSETTITSPGPYSDFLAITTYCGSLYNDVLNFMDNIPGPTYFQSFQKPKIKSKNNIIYKKIKTIFFFIIKMMHCNKAIYIKRKKRKQ